LLEEKGFRAISAAKCLTAWSHEGRVRNEAAFAALAGVSPNPASSGNTIRHRLNRGGDRALNSALHMVAVTRVTHDTETTRQYVENDAPKAARTRKSAAASIATWPVASTGRSVPHPKPRTRLDRHRRVHRPHTAIGGHPPISRLTNLPGQYS
jgi:transposase